jgi:hypothetical protein
VWNVVIMAAIFVSVIAFLVASMESHQQVFTEYAC